MIYCFDQGLIKEDGSLRDTMHTGEYYRSTNTPVTFVFTKMLTTLELERIYYHLKIQGENVIWLYTGFTGNTVTPISYTLEDLVKTFDGRDFTHKQLNSCYRFSFYNDSYTDAFFNNGSNRFVDHTDTYSKGHLSRRDFYSHGLIYSEFYRQKDGLDMLYLRRFYKMDKTTGFDEINTEDSVKYVFDETFVESKDALVGMMIKQMNFSREDTIILDYDHKYLQQILTYKNGANLMMTSSSRREVFEDRFNM